MKLKCIAIDDEPLALNMIKKYIGKVPFLELIDVFESPYLAMPAIKEHDVQLIFLDIQMPDLTGIQFIKSISQVPYIIFTTAYSQYAVEGFELNVADYLLKPFSFERFLRAVNKVLDLHKLNHQPVQEASNDYIFIKAEHNVIKINLHDIFYIEGFKDYIKIHTRDKRPLMTIKSIKSMEEILENKGFLRIHRSYIIAIDKIDSFRNGRVKIKEKTLPIGESFRERFFEFVVKDKL